jgi:hypothetical protein
MSPDLSPARVALRLERLRASYVAESAEDARRRLAREAESEGRRNTPLAEAAARRLAELRALCELTDYLHRRRAG